MSTPLWAIVLPLGMIVGLLWTISRTLERIEARLKAPPPMFD